MKAPRLLPVRFERTGQLQTDNGQRNAAATQKQVNQLPDVGSVVLGPHTFGSVAEDFEFAHKLQRVPTELRAIWVEGGYGAFYVVEKDEFRIKIRSGFACTATFRVS